MDTTTSRDPGDGPASLVDPRYRLDDAELVARCHRQMATEGVCILPGFLRPEVVAALVPECDRLAPLAHHSVSVSSPYLRPPEPNVPPGDPRGRAVGSAVAAVAYDLFPPDSLLRRLYEWDGLMDFVAAVLGEPVLHRYGDPFGALNVAVMREGDELGWHFDMTDFVVSIAVQASEGGGLFENAWRLRSADDENLPGVQAVLDGEASGRVRTEPMTPGTLMLFNGRWSMHRVTPVEGPVPRYVALLAYDRRPGTDSTDQLKMNRYGRLPGDPVPVAAR